jgi:hypothetical protein
MLATFPLYLALLALIKLKLLLKYIHFVLIRALQTLNKCRFKHTFIMQLVKLLSEIGYDKVEE